MKEDRLKEVETCINLNKYMYANRSSAIRAIGGKPKIGMLRQYYILVISKSNRVLQVSGCSIFNKKYISLHKLYLKLYLKLSQDLSSTSCITIHSVSSNSKQYSSILNLETIHSVHGVNPHFEIKHLTKWQSVQFVLRVQTFDCLNT